MAFDWGKAVGIGGGVLSAAGGLFSTIAGIGQTRKGNRILENAIAPVYTRPSEVGKSLALTENNYLNGTMPGTGKLIDQIGSAGANALDNSIQAATSGADVQDAITKLNYNEQQQLNDVATQEQNFKQQQEQDYLNQLATSAGYADKEFEINQLTPYRNKIAQGQSLIGAGNINTASGIGDLSKLGAGLATNYLNSKVTFDPYNKTVKTGV